VNIFSNSSVSIVTAFVATLPVCLSFELRPLNIDCTIVKVQISSVRRKGDKLDIRTGRPKVLLRHWSTSVMTVSIGTFPEIYTTINQRGFILFSRRRSACCTVVGYLCGMRLKVKQLVDSEYFQRGILFAILVNTLSMGIEYHNQVKHCL